MPLRSSLLAAILLTTFAAGSICTAAVQTREVAYDAGSVKARGFAAWDDVLEGKRPTVLIFPEWWGLTDYPKARARQLAALGYFAFVADVYGDGKALDDAKEAQKLATALYDDPKQLLQRAQAALAAVAAQPQADAQRTAAIGYCMGGSVALQLARAGADIKATVGLHTSLLNRDPSLTGPIRAKILILNGADDTMVSAKEYEDFENEMRAKHADWVLVLYGGALHSYSNPISDRYKSLGPVGYNAAADKRSWRHMLDLFDEAIGSPKAP